MIRTVGVRPDEAGLVRRARRGEREAFDGLVRLHFGRVYSVLFRLLGNHEDAEDLAQECFVRCYQALGLYREEGSFEAWLVRIAVHLARDHRRRVVRRGPLLDVAAHEPAARGEEGSDEREIARALGASIDRLPEHLRVALVLRVLEGMEYEEVARVTGMRPGTVRTQVMKARRLLQRYLAPWIGRER